MQFDIEFINKADPTISYEDQAVAEFEAGLGDGVDKFTQQFEQDYAGELRGKIGRAHV